MSHLKEREEQVCLNCNAALQGTFCHICGQENIEPRESLWNLISHFFKDITHFDGKFFSTLHLLITRPGYLSREYMLGRRASYLNPIRMYIFTSAFFFLIFFNFFQAKDNALMNTVTINGASLEKVEAMDSLSFDQFTREVNRDDDKPALPMTRKEYKRYVDSTVKGFGVRFTSTRYASREAYDSVLRSGKKNHNWIQRQLIYKEIDLNEKYKNDGMLAFTAIKDSILHSIPQMLFISLPLLAMLLKLLYVRRKHFYYVTHGIFSVHLYIFIFISLLVILSMGKLNDVLDWGALTFIRSLLLISLFFYAYKAMRNFYQQRRAKTIFKFLVLCFLFALTIVLLFTIFIILSIFKI